MFLVIKTGCILESGKCILSIYKWQFIKCVYLLVHTNACVTKVTVYFLLQYSLTAWNGMMLSFSSWLHNGPLMSNTFLLAFLDILKAHTSTFGVQTWNWKYPSTCQQLLLSPKPTSFCLTSHPSLLIPLFKSVLFLLL